MAATKLIIILESVLQSWSRDAGTFATFIAMIGIGVALDSGAMQWVGAILGFLVIGARASKMLEELTIEAARRRLDELEREVTHDER